MANPFVTNPPSPPWLDTGYLQKVLSGITVERAAAVDVGIRNVNCYGYKASSSSGNTDNSAAVYLGWDDDHQPIVLNPGETQAIIIRGDAGGMKNLRELRVRGASGDGVLFEFDKGPKSEQS